MMKTKKIVFACLVALAAAALPSRAMGAWVTGCEAEVVDGDALTCTPSTDVSRHCVVAPPGSRVEGWAGPVEEVKLSDSTAFCLGKVAVPATPVKVKVGKAQVTFAELFSPRWRKLNAEWGPATPDKLPAILKRQEALCGDPAAPLLDRAHACKDRATSALYDEKKPAEAVRWNMAAAALLTDQRQVGSRLNAALGLSASYIEGGQYALGEQVLQRLRPLLELAVDQRVWAALQWARSQSRAKKIPAVLLGKTAADAVALGQYQAVGEHHLLRGSALLEASRFAEAEAEFSAGLGAFPAGTSEPCRTGIMHAARALSLFKGGRDGSAELSVARAEYAKCEQPRTKSVIEDAEKAAKAPRP